jgi:phage/plasmid-associated DNA primase
LIFRLSRYTPKHEARRIYEYLISSYKTCDNLLDASRIFFGAYDRDSVHILSESATLDTDVFLAADIPTIEIDYVTREVNDTEGNTPTTVSQAPLPKDGEGVRGAVLRWLNRSVWNDICLIDDIDKLYCLHPHRFEDQGKAAGYIRKWGGHRPEDTEKNTGTGFFVFWKNHEQLPIFDNSNSANSKMMKGNFIEYWHYYGNLLHSKGWGDIDYDQDRKYINYRQVCDDIARHFDIPRFDFDSFISEKQKQRKEKNQTIKNDLCTQVETVLQMYCKLIKKGGKDSYLYYDFMAGVWRIKPYEYNVFRECVKYALKNHHGVENEVLNEPKTAAYIESIIKRFDKYESIEDKIDFDEMRNADIIPLANGDWNWRTKEFMVNFSPSNYNMTRSKKYFRELTGVEAGVALLNYWLDEIGYTDLQRSAVRSWLIVNCLGIAQQTKRMLNVYGTPETGKTVIGQLIQGCLGSLCVTARGNTMTDAGNRFANQSLDGAFAVFIDEFRTDAGGWEMIKQLVGNANITIEVEKKNMSAYNTKFFAGITTATQDKFFIPNSDDGGIRRRVVLLQHTKAMHKSHLADIDIQFSKPDILADIFNWCIQQDGEQAVSDFIAYAKSDTAKSILQASLVQNDTVLQFIEEMVIFTDSENDLVSNHELQVLYQAWLEQEIGANVANDTMKTRISKIPQNIREKAEIKDNGIKWSLMPEKGKDSKVKISGKFVRGFRGMTLKRLESDLPI